MAADQCIIERLFGARTSDEAVVDALDAANHDRARSFVRAALFGTHGCYDWKGWRREEVDAIAMRYAKELATHTATHYFMTQIPESSFWAESSAQKDFIDVSRYAFVQLGERPRWHAGWHYERGLGACRGFIYGYESSIKPLIDVTREACAFVANTSFFGRANRIFIAGEPAEAFVEAVRIAVAEIVAWTGNDPADAVLSVCTESMGAFDQVRVDAPPWRMPPGRTACCVRLVVTRLRSTYRTAKRRRRGGDDGGDVTSEQLV